MSKTLTQEEITRNVEKLNDLANKISDELLKELNGLGADPALVNRVGRAYLKGLGFETSVNIAYLITNRLMDKQNQVCQNCNDIQCAGCKSETATAP